MIDESDLIRNICLNPDDDTPRLIYADWLDERGQVERAEFIRVQIDISNAVGPARKLQGKSDSLFQKYKKQWFGDVHAKIESIYISRGFPTSVTLPLAVFVGGECDNCQGAGVIRERYFDGTEEGQEEQLECTKCNGTGRIPGIAKELFEKWPITKVTISDYVIHPSGGNNTYYLGGLGLFPSHYWRRLENHPSRMDVVTALSNVCVDYGRQLAGLPAIKVPL